MDPVAEEPIPLLPHHEHLPGFLTRRQPAVKVIGQGGIPIPVQVSPASTRSLPPVLPPAGSGDEEGFQDGPGHLGSLQEVLLQEPLKNAPGGFQRILPHPKPPPSGSGRTCPPGEHLQGALRGFPPHPCPGADVPEGHLDPHVVIPVRFSPRPGSDGPYNMPERVGGLLPRREDHGAESHPDPLGGGVRLHPPIFVGVSRDLPPLPPLCLPGSSGFFRRDKGKGIGSHVTSRGFFPSFLGNQPLKDAPQGTRGVSPMLSLIA